MSDATIRSRAALNDLSGYALETLREDRDFILYRGRNHNDGSSVLALGPVEGRFAPDSLKRLEHECSLASELDSSWAVRPRALTHHAGRTLLILEDMGGEPLTRQLAEPLALGRFLHWAVGLAVAVGRLHADGLIHKDIKPANIMVDIATGTVRLMGFGVATRLPRERQAPSSPPDVIAGTLAYMAPEQTGRMNRSIDARSDLYALGVTLYEMLTGTLPFSAADPLEWVHCHIARRPAPPEERRPETPAPLSAIVLKLLAKTAEDRYQTAAGVAFDLRRCLGEWETRGWIEPFALAAHDVPDTLRIPEKLYGREHEVSALSAAFERMVAGGTPELVLLSGGAGIGKSSVVNELHKALVPSRGLFAVGKADQYKRDIPYATLAQAFQNLIQQLLGKSDAEVTAWREALVEAVGLNGQLLVNLIPQLELLIGTQRPVPDLPPQDAQHRFHTVIRRLFGVFARPEHPLVLFLDDLQWIDFATAGLVEHLLSAAELRHLLLIGAYRNEEVDSSHLLMRTLDVVRSMDARITQIVLKPLSSAGVGRLIGDTVSSTFDRVEPLADLVAQEVPA